MPKVVSNYIEVHITFNNKFLLLKRAEQNSVYPNLWQMVTAKIEKDEETKTTILREVNEETGLKAAKIYVMPRVNTFYLPFIDSISLSPVFLVFVNSDEVKISYEHSEYKWVTFDEAMELIHWENQKDSLTEIKKYLDDEKLFNKLVEMKL